MAESTSKLVFGAVYKLTRYKCEEMLTGIGIQCYDDESTTVLQDAVYNAVIEGDLAPRDILSA
jgi:hypothetical protein